ncbi:hypothetical protein LMG24238_04330 [Paraburkholderia sediminicola]|uniref:Uncharacterized protein n=1 Tax=Paraburkholderia sediminicola TaxID=458836 RepID=A0A6J5BNV1_9BURK|nr:hypothetical protein LMG24238_04330 [Paraburkholderia sediminicola]
MGQVMGEVMGEVMDFLPDRLFAYCPVNANPPDCHPGIPIAALPTAPCGPHAAEPLQ